VTVREGHSKATAGRWLLFTAVARNEFRLIRGERSGIIGFVIIPLAITGFANPVYSKVVPGTSGHGATFFLPGLAVLYAFFLAPSGGYSIFREHGWNTWSRLRMVDSGMLSVLFGKVAPWSVIVLLQQSVLFVFGYFVLGFSPKGPSWALAAVVVAVALVVGGTVILLAAMCRTVYQVTAFGSLGVILMAGVGGTYAPVTELPGWVQLLARVTPTYWATRAFREVAVGGRGLIDILPELAVLGAMSVALAALGVVRFRADVVKRSWAA
jgi:ABC-2 type transport system permease protein